MSDLTLCCMHNSGEQPRSAYLMRLPIGNVISLCEPCCAWWRQSAVDDPADASIQPVWIRSHR